MRTFVMGDIHGNYSALMQCLERSEFDRKKDRLIQLGDVVDGHADSFKCVEELLCIRYLIAVRGNHDAWFLEFIETGYHPAMWEFGGVQTALSYLRQIGTFRFTKNKSDIIHLVPRHIPAKHKQFFRSQRLYFIDEKNNCFVHAGFDPNRSFNNQRPEIYYWDRELWSNALIHLVEVKYKSETNPFYIKTGFNNIFIGHTNTLHWKLDRPMKAFNIYNIDTGAGSKSKGRLTIMNVETKEWFQSDINCE